MLLTSFDINLFYISKRASNMRMKNKVDFKSVEECWNRAGPPYKGHRRVYRAFYGEYPDGMYVLHKCNNKYCVNPTHLFLGTQQQNIKQAYDQGRHPGNKGKKLKYMTEETVRAVRADLQAGLKQVEIAKKYGITQSQVSQLKNGHIRSQVK